MIDYLIVGAGLSGATFARIKADQGHRVRVIEQRPHPGGNCHDRIVDEIIVGSHGGHIFHTNSPRIWSFVRQYATMTPYRHRVIANYNGAIYSLPINMQTYYEAYGARTPAEAKRAIELWGTNAPGDNLRDHAIRTIGSELYEVLIRHYTARQWGRDPESLPVSILARIPLRFTWNNDYFSDTYQGIPRRGYTDMITNMLEGIPVEYNREYNPADWIGAARHTIYTGPIDDLFGCDAGTLEYRSLRWEHDHHDRDQHGIATVNYTGPGIAHTRVIEWRHFMGRHAPRHSITSTEYPQPWQPGRERYYPIPTQANRELAELYQQRAKNSGIIPLGRLAEYKYLDMDQAIARAMKIAGDI